MSSNFGLVGYFENGKECKQEAPFLVCVWQSLFGFEARLAAKRLW